MVVGKLRNKNKMQRRRLSVNFNFLGFVEEEGGFSSRACEEKFQ